MDAILKPKIIVFIFVFFSLSHLTAQVNNVNRYISEVENKVNRINQMANSKQVIEAMNLLNETRRDFDTYLNYYFENEMRAAKAENSGFNPQLNVQISSVLTASYWESKVEQAQRSVNLAEEAFSERNHRRTLDSQDEVWAYLKTIYGVGKTIKDVYENVQTLELYDAIKSAKEGVDGFIENYEEIENARLQIINTELYETQVKGLISRGKRMEERCWQFASFMRAYEQDVNDFYSLIKRFNQKANQIQNETVINWSSPEYSWNKQNWLNQINGLGRDFKAGNFDYVTLKQKIENVNDKAESEKNKVYQNIQNSGANDAFERGVKLDEEFEDFYNLSIDVLDECYTVSKKNEKATAGDAQIEQTKTTSETVNNTVQIFAGVETGQQTENKINNTIQNNTSGSATQNNFAAAGFIGMAENNGNGNGKYCSVEISKLNKTDNIIFNVISGELKKVEIIWRTSGGSWRTQYEGTKTEFNAEEFLKDVPDFITHFNFTVNAHHNSSYLPNACKAEVWCLAPGQSIPARPSNQNQQTASVQKQNTTPATPSKNTSGKPEKVSNAVNKMPKTGSSQMARIPVYKLMENEKLVFKQTGGTFLKFWVRWSGKSFSEVLFEDTKQIVYSTAELMAKRPEKAMFLDFQVNQYSDVHCYMEGWVLPGGVPIPADWNIAENSNSTAGAGSASNNFYDLIKQADEAFNRKYWNESGGVRASSNPKQESLDLLRKCEPIIARENNFSTKYEMIKTLSGKYSEYAKRVFAFSAKSDFIELSGRLLSKYGSQVNSEKDSKLKSNAYKTMAEGWRNLTQAATWGNHQYNKMYCDKEAKKYYDYALREDRNNTQLQKTVEKINAPKKPIPAKVASTPPIAEEKWAIAENFRNAMVNDNLDESILKKEPVNYMEVGVLKLNVGSGDVWIMVSGTSEWRKITDNSVVVYPGDKIKTSGNAQNVSFTYSRDNSYLAIKSDAVVTIYEEQLCIQRGDVYVNVTKKGDKFLVITPTAVTGPRGTEFSVNVSPAGQTNVHLYEGAIELRNASEISYLVPGEKASIKAENEEITTQTFNIQHHKQQNWNTSNMHENGFHLDKNLFKNVTGGGQIFGNQ
ncbi:FecR domain-containing protein [Mariniphaga sediminis]|nr:FecR domain-containing protein [Mariniphaga sediminis]